MLVLGLISGIPTFVVGQVAGLLGSNLWYVGVVLSYVATALAAPIEPLGLTVYYYSMRARETPSPAAPPIFLTPS
jgi:hypothetical protein